MYKHMGKVVIKILQGSAQWRSNGLCSMCKAQGPTSLRGPLGLS